MNLKATTKNLANKINHPFFTHDFYFSISYLVLAGIFLLLAIVSIVAPTQSHLIILAGLVPITIFSFFVLILLLIANIADFKHEIYKSWKFWLIIGLILVHTIGISVVWSYIVPNFDKFCDYYKNLNTNPEQGLGPATELVNNPLMQEIRISLWFYMIFMFCIFVGAIVMMIFAWKDRFDQKNIITDDKLVQDFIDKNNNNVEFETLSDVENKPEEITNQK